MRIFAKLAAAPAAALLLVSCGSSTGFLHTWKDPEAAPLQFKKVLVLMISPDESIRRAVEDRMSAKMKRTQAVSSYTILTKKEIDDVEQAKNKVKELGFDGAVTFKVTKAGEKITTVSGRYYPDPYAFWNYYSYSWPVVYESGFMTTKQAINVESKIFSLADEKLIWAGISETVDPEGLRDIVDQVANAAARELKNQKLIK